MLKLSNRGLYGVKALYELAIRYGGTPITIREISERHGLPVAFLEQVLHTLKKEKLVESHRGANGGYSLARDPEDQEPMKTTGRKGERTGRLLLFRYPSTSTRLYQARDPA